MRGKELQAYFKGRRLVGKEKDVVVSLGSSDAISSIGS